MTTEELIKQFKEFEDWDENSDGERHHYVCWDELARFVQRLLLEGKIEELGKHYEWPENLDRIKELEVELEQMNRRAR